VHTLSSWKLQCNLRCYFVYHVPSGPGDFWDRICWVYFMSYSSLSWVTVVTSRECCCMHCMWFLLYTQLYCSCLRHSKGCRFQVWEHENNNTDVTGSFTNGHPPSSSNDIARGHADSRRRQTRSIPNNKDGVDKNLWKQSA
jgi:hypothetical protein